MFLIVLVWMCAYEVVAFGGDGLAQGNLHFGLFGPALLIGGKAEVAAGDELHLFLAKPGGFGDLGHVESGHGGASRVSRKESILRGETATEAPRFPPGDILPVRGGGWQEAKSGLRAWYFWDKLGTVKVGRSGRRVRAGWSSQKGR